MSKKLLLLVTVLALGLTVFSGCEDAAEEDVNPLVGTWVMSNLYQDIELLTREEAMGMAIGTSMGRDTLTWETFSALGVNATVVLNADESFELQGSFPVANDTLYVAPSIVPLTDSGTWTVPADMSTLLIDGGIYDLGGALTMDNETNPTVISMAYMTSDTLTVVLPMMGSYLDFKVTKNTIGIMGFTKQ